ncbi:hypothetical protein L6164_016742 [Bauhinia variegata]|uniref:Uncharacterized protein n=1 Tax=Bauhinia variegata TaxID=167791 RepID=A0ACB9N790_BAUVA|nr:hypothetical protein L6164_016742 [Bauhinia variegata]
MDRVLEYNEFYGNLPAELGNLTQIERLHLTSNNFTGELPPAFAKLTALKELIMVGSGFSGPIPSGIFSSLKNLTDLEISDLNGPDSTFPQLNEIENLERLILRSCNINGTLPAYLGNMTHLNILYLTGNLLTGLLPGWTENMGTSNSIKPYFCVDTSSCSTTTSLHINCGGPSLTLTADGNKTLVYDADQDVVGAASFEQSRRNWAISNTGEFVDSSGHIPYYAWTDESMTNDLGKTARVSAISLTYYGFCLYEGNYTVSLHFAEIMFTDNKTFSSLGRRVFNVYIQGKLELENFDIVKAAGGVGIVTIQNFTAFVNSSGTLEIFFYWAGKGTTAIPFKSVYGPLISAISVDADFTNPLQSKHGSSMPPWAVGGIVAAGVIIIILAHLLKEKGNLMELVDPRLGSDFKKEEAMVMIEVGLLCTNVTAARRPTMSSVVSMLEGRVVVPALVSDSNESFDEIKLEEMRQYYRNTEENKIIETNTQSASIDGAWTVSSSSAVDLYPVHLDSSYWDKRN